jgi:hypothetical protein
MNTPGFTAEASLYKSNEPNHLGTANSLAPQMLRRNAVQPAINCRACIEAGGECLCGGRGCFCV